ncbi:hypothetical protein [Riemerella columbina]|uniref:hypothetical protein n=1 Tax=Riemerella columbina TaxID=103810 RepID=UPI0026703DC3|nr:hypothetical protein [Riemerella columbina]WKS95887.1 hypothetical protein NYR17_03915 [Riemerella columbina]
MRTTDNNGGVAFDLEDVKLEDLSIIANQPLKTLQKENPELLIFPSYWGEYGDDIQNSCVFF